MKSILAILISPFTAIWHGYVLRILWGWFLVPYFGISGISIPQAIGISIVSSYLTHQIYTGPDEEKDETKRWFRSLFLAILWPAMTLLTGYVVHLFL